MMWKFVGASKASILYIYISIIIIIIKTTSFKEKDEIRSHGCVWWHVRRVWVVLNYIANQWWFRFEGTPFVASIKKN